MEINGKECTTHKIKISNYFEGLIHIPNEMDAMDLKALTQQANSIFKVAQIDFERNTNEEKIRQNQNLKTTLPIESKPKRKYKYKKVKRASWTDNKIEQLKELHSQGLDCNQIGEQMGMTYLQIYSKLNILGLKINTDKNAIRYRKGKYSLKEKQNLLNEYLYCNTTSERNAFAKKFNIDLRMFQKQKYNWKLQLKNARQRGDI